MRSIVRHLNVDCHTRDHVVVLRDCVHDQMEGKNLKESSISKKDTNYGKKTYLALVFICKTQPYVPPHHIAVAIIIELLNGGRPDSRRCYTFVVMFV